MSLAKAPSHRFLLAGAVLVWASVVIDAGQAGVDMRIGKAIASYASGSPDEVAEVANLRELSVGRLLDGLERWIRIDTRASIDGRRRVACGFALNTVWAATRGPLNSFRVTVDPWGRARPDRPDQVKITSYVAEGIVASWVAQTIRLTQPRADMQSLDRLELLAALAVASDGSAWHRIRADVLPAARARLGGEPRVTFTTALAKIWPVVEATLPRNLLHRNDVLRRAPDSRPPATDVLRAVAELDTVRDDPSLAWEVDVWASYLYSRLEDWEHALERLNRAGPVADVPLGAALVGYFGGWIHEQRSEPTAAVSAYRRALEAMPNQPEVVWRLAALLYLSGTHEEAYELLLPMTVSRPVSPGLLPTLERGDARFAAGLLAAIRKALQ